MILGPRSTGGKFQPFPPLEPKATGVKHLGYSGRQMQKLNRTNLRRSQAPQRPLNDWGRKMRERDERLKRNRTLIRAAKKVRKIVPVNWMGE